VYLDTQKKMHLPKGAGFEDDLAKDKGWLFHDPTQARHKEKRKGTETYKAKLFHGKSI
jgi:hypothetical protein